MRSGIPLSSVLLGAAILALFSCSDDITQPGPGGTGTLPFYADVAVPGVSTLVVEVTAADIPASNPLVFNFELGVDGVAQGTVEIPAGAARVVTVRAFDADGTQTHEGQETVDVSPGPNPGVAITLAPLPGGVPITVVLGEFDIEITPTDPTIDLGTFETGRLTARVVGLDANGGVTAVLDVDVRWATDAPTVATVDPTGLVTGASGGVARIVATYAGVGEAVFVTVLNAPLRNEIAFISHRDGNAEIYVMNTDGTEQTNLSQNVERDLDPVISPDGRRIAFGRDDDGNGFTDEIHVMNADGTGQTNLSQNAAVDSNARWSPDGTQIAFMSIRDGNSEIYVMDADGTGQTNLSQNEAIDGLPRWSPDGTQIAFMSVRDGNREIYVMNADGTGQTNLSQNRATNVSPQWSPDGTQIAFESNRDGNWEIHVMNADGTGQTNLSQNAARDSNARWSPDGTQIAFVSNRDGNSEIYVMNADGTGQTNLSQNAATDAAPRWSPDGTQIVFERDDDGDQFSFTDEIYIMNADGTGQINLTENPQRDWFPVWSPQ